MDNDTVSASNINRQVLFSPRDVGRRKVEAAKEKLDTHNIRTGMVPPFTPSYVPSFVCVCVCVCVCVFQL